MPVGGFHVPLYFPCDGTQWISNPGTCAARARTSAQIPGVFLGSRLLPIATRLCVTTALLSMRTTTRPHRVGGAPLTLSSHTMCCSARITCRSAVASPA